MHEKIPGEFIVKIPIRNEAGHVVGTREFITYQGLLAIAHGQGLVEMDTTLLQSPSEANGRVAIVRASARGSVGTFTGLGDASPENVDRRVAPHLLRVAETRAKARALRDMTNVAMVALEELGGEDRLDVNPPYTRPATSEPASTAGATDSQRRALWRKAQVLGYDRRTAAAFLAQRLGSEIKSMSKQQATHLLNELQREVQAAIAGHRRAAE